MPSEPHLGPNIFRYVVRPRQRDDPRSANFITDAHALGLTEVSHLECSDLYFLEGQLSTADLQRIAAELLSDSITQTVEWGRFLLPPPAQINHPPQPYIVEVALHPGVTDPVAEQILHAAKILGIPGLERACTGQRFAVYGTYLHEEDVHLLARRLLANPVIQRYSLGEIGPIFPHPAESSGRFELLSIRTLSPDQLIALSLERRAALDLAEMQAVQEYYLQEGRDPTDVEFETIAQTWSEHCVHKTFKARVSIPSQPERGQDAAVIDGLLRTYLRAATDEIAAPWVRSAFVDNAGILDFDDQYEISFKVETHNHPSAIEPFGGANTGVGGVIRDILGVSAKPIAATDVLCFGPQDLDFRDLPEGVLHPRRIRSGVVAGVQDYGNKIGIPTVNGAILYDPGYTANPLVFCGCVGIAPKDSHPRFPLVGDRMIVLGGRTGRDGLRGATFSSMTMDGQTGEVAGASVQIGDPITEKGLIEVCLRARDAGLYHAITDCGAGGLSSAVGEMASRTGADVDLLHVRLKYPGLAPWEIWLSEAQERMVLAVPGTSLPRLQSLCKTFEVELTDIGFFTETGRLVVRYDGEIVLDLENEFLFEGIPQRSLTAVLPETFNTSPETKTFEPGLVSTRSMDPNAALLSLLGDPNIASKADVIRIYDHEVQGGTVVKPLTGMMNDGPSDACVLKPLGTQGARGIALANGINPQYGKLDPYRMAVSVIDEAIRNAVAVGADPERIALLDNFCWGDPRRPETLGALVEAGRGCYDAALHYHTPFISGKDSLNNEYTGADGQRQAIPPTLLISAIGILEDVNQAVTMDLKTPGDPVYLIGRFQAGSGRGDPSGGNPVPVLPEEGPHVYRALHRAIRAGLVRACHDLSEGGLAAAAAEMCIGGRLGLALTVDAGGLETALFGETNGCLLVEAAGSEKATFESHFAGLPFQEVGAVSSDSRLTIRSSEGVELISLPVSKLVAAWNRIP